MTRIWNSCQYGEYLIKYKEEKFIILCNVISFTTMNLYVQWIYKDEFVGLQKVTAYEQAYYNFPTLK